LCRGAQVYIRFKEIANGECRWVFRVVCTVALSLAVAGCHRAGNAGASEGAEGEFVQAFLAAHANKDLDAEEKLVDWDNVAEASRNHFIGNSSPGWT